MAQAAGSAAHVTQRAVFHGARIAKNLAGVEGVALSVRSWSRDAA